MRLRNCAALVFVFSCLLVGCGGSNTSATPQGNVFRISDSFVKDVGGLSKIVLHNGVGNIDIKPSAGNQLKVGYEKVARNASKELADELFQKVTVKSQIEGNTVTVEADWIEAKDAIIAKYKSKLDIAKVSFEINYVLEVPANLNDFDVSAGVGNVTLTGLKGVFSLETRNGDIALAGNMTINGGKVIKAGNGSIVLKDNVTISGGTNIETGNGGITLKENVTISGDTSIVTGNGTINVELAAVKLTREVNIEAKSGIINLSLPDALNCTLKIKRNMQNYWETFDHNGGGVTIILNAAMGTVNYDFY